MFSVSVLFFLFGTPTLQSSVTSFSCLLWPHSSTVWYGVATVSRIHKIKVSFAEHCLFCRALLQRDLQFCRSYWPKPHHNALILCFPSQYSFSSLSRFCKAVSPVFHVYSPLQHSLALHSDCKPQLGTPFHRWHSCFVKQRLSCVSFSSSELFFSCLVIHPYLYVLFSFLQIHSKQCLIFLFSILCHIW